MKNFITYIITVLIPILYSIVYYNIDPVDCLGVLGGLFIWSAAEYGFHRFAFHNTNLSPRTYKLLAYNHMNHHKRPNNGEDLLLPLRLTVPVALTLFTVAALLLGVPFATFLLIGMFLGLAFYELVHHQSHNKVYNVWPFNYLARRHMKHHYENEDRMFGVTSPLWDRLLGTR
jgi:sterol desaturase/sphingolipid hydroxylase (fatty acid hydroxylase superfamily)